MNIRAETRDQIAVAKAQFAENCAALRDQLPHIKKIPGNLTEDLDAIMAQLDEMRTKRNLRERQFAKVIKQINNTSEELSRSVEANLKMMIIDGSDLSLKSLEESQNQLLLLEKQKDAHLEKVYDLLKTLLYTHGWVLKSDFKLKLHTAYPKPDGSCGTVSIKLDSIESLTSTMCELMDIKLLWMHKLVDLAMTMLELWNLMNTPVEERTMFQNMAASENEITDSNSLSLEVWNNAEAEVKRLQDKNARQIKLVNWSNERILGRICKMAHSVINDQFGKYCLLDATESGPNSLLEHLEAQIREVQDEAARINKILEKVQKWLSICGVENSLEKTLAGIFGILLTSEPNGRDWEALPLDVWTVVLCNLSPESLVRLRKVSIPYRSFLTCRDFIQEHIRITSKEKLVMWSVRGGRYLVHFSFPHLLSSSIVNLPPNSSSDANFSKYTVLLGSCDGIICLRGSRSCSSWLAVWNPLLRLYLYVPSPILNVPSCRWCSRTLYAGLGYDSNTNDYKMMCIIKHDGCLKGFLADLMLYSFQTREWKVISDCYAVGDFQTVGVDLNIMIMGGMGKFHWIDDVRGKWIFNSFDMATEELESLQLPLDNKMCCSMVVSDRNSAVYVVGCCNNHMVCLLKEELGWRELFRVELVEKSVLYLVGDLRQYNLLKHSRTGIRNDFQLFDVLDGGEIIFRLKRTFLVFNPKDGSMKAHNIECNGNVFAACKYVKSVAWVV